MTTTDINLSFVVGRLSARVAVDQFRAELADWAEGVLIKTLSEPSLQSTAEDRAEIRGKAKAYKAMSRLLDSIQVVD